MKIKQGKKTLKDLSKGERDDLLSYVLFDCLAYSSKGNAVVGEEVTKVLKMFNLIENEEDDME